MFARLLKKNRDKSVLSHVTEKMIKLWWIIV